MPAVPKATLFQSNTTSFPDNNLGEITPADLRDFNDSMITSLVDEIPYGTFTASVNNSISALNTFTASGYPSYTALNSFTASQLTINTGVNLFTQSANSSITQLNSQTASFNTWTASINQIQSNGTVLGNATRINLVGSTTFFSASLVQNVLGPIATLTFTSDNSKTNTSSFNDYTASNSISINALNQFTASQTTWNASATASISQLLSFSSSLDATYATDAQLNAATASLINQINTKLDTSSFNSYTQSLSNLLSGSYATTGSNTFNGNQIITGSLFVSGSSTADIVVNGQVFISSSTSGSANAARLDISGAAALSGGSRTARVFVRPQDIQLVRGGYNTTITPNQYALYASSSTGFFGVSSTTEAQAYVSAQNASTLAITQITLTATPTLGALQDWDDLAGTSSTFMQIGYNDGITPPIPQFTRGLSISGSGGLQVTGSAYGNVVSASIASSTASIDLSKGNYFTLTLAGTTNINVTNAQPGVTATLVINTSTAASASFSNNVKQPSGSFYAASPSGNIDIISFTAVNSTTVYAFPAQSFV